MDQLTHRIVQTFESKSNSQRFPLKIEKVVFDGVRDSGIRKFHWRVITSLPAAQTFTLCYDEYGTVLVSCSSEVIVNLSELSDEKWVVSLMELKGGHPELDVYVEIKEVSRSRSQKDRFLASEFVSKWPHLEEHANVLFELGLIVQTAVFESVSSGISALVEI